MFDDIIEQFSPSKRFRLTFHNFEEPTMCYNVCKFYLTDLQAYETVDFKPLWAIGAGKSGYSWSENEKFLSIPIASLPTEDFLICNIESRKFTSLRFGNCWVLNGRCHDDYIEIEYDERIEGENLKYPTKDLKKPGNIRFMFSKLKWTAIEFLEQFNELNKNAVVYDFKPLDHGWRQFKGQLPQTTEIIVWELKKFAEYGDSQSIEWFDEIQKKTNDIDYWVNASRYLGLRTRK
jgi:hypothetical protein